MGFLMVHHTDPLCGEVSCFQVIQATTIIYKNMMSTSELLLALLNTDKTMQVMQKHYREGDACRDNLTECALQIRDL